MLVDDTKMMLEIVGDSVLWCELVSWLMMIS